MENYNFESVIACIQNRRSTLPVQFKEGKIPKEILTSVLESVRFAPTHKRTEPWRFVLFQDQSKQDLAEFFYLDYQKQTKQELQTEEKKLKSGKKVLQSAAVMAICVHRSPAEQIPEWEETAAVACAVENFWLSMTAMGLAGYWSSPEARNSFISYFNLNAEWECLGFFYLGWPVDGLGPKERSRKPLEEIVIWK